MKKTYDVFRASDSSLLLALEGRGKVDFHTRFHAMCYGIGEYHRLIAFK